MTDEQPTDPRAPIIGRLAKKFGLPPEVFTGTGDGKPPAIEVDLDPAGGRHQLVWRGGSGRTIAGMVTVHADGRVVNEGVPRQQWRPSILSVDATLAAWVNIAAAHLAGLIEARMEAAERCRHGHTDPDCPICHVGERDPDEPEGVELNLRRRKFPPPAAQPQAVAKFRALYSGGMGPTLEVDSNELAHVLNYVQEVEDSVTRSRVRAQDLAAAHHEAEQWRAEAAELRAEVKVRRADSAEVQRLNDALRVANRNNVEMKRHLDRARAINDHVAQDVTTAREAAAGDASQDVITALDRAARILGLEGDE